MIEASCHCGAVRMQIDEAPPEFLTDCNCSICRRNGGLWAYFRPDQVKLAAPQGTDIYVWGDKMIEFHRCRTCGNHTHWSPVDRTHPRMGVNARMFDPDLLAKLKIRKFDGASTWRFFDED